MSKLRLLLPLMLLLCSAQHALATPFDAVKANDVKALQQYLDDGFNIEKTNSWGYTLVMYAVEHNAKDALRLLVERGAKINRFKRNYNNSIFQTYNPLTTALFANKTDMVRLLVELGADVDIQFSYNIDFNDRSTMMRFYTPLSYAISEKKDAQVKLLLSLGADVNKEGVNIYLPIAAAVDAKRHDYLKLLLKQGADPAIHNTNGYPLLYQAIDEGSKDIALTLIKAKADPNSKHRGKTALMLALQKKLTSVANTLLDAGADINIIDSRYYDNNYGTTALMKAIEAKSPLIDKIVAMGADLDVRNSDEISIPQLAIENNIPVEPLLTEKNQQYGNLLYAAVEANDLELVNKFIDLKLDMNRMYRGFDEANTPLTLAIKNNYVAIVKTLVKHGAKLTDVPQVAPAIYAAVDLEGTELTTYLLEHGADPNDFLNSYGFYPFSPLSGANRQNMKVLLAHGAKLNPTDMPSPLMLVALNGLSDDIDYLISLGAKVNIQSSIQYTPLMYAATNGGYYGFGDEEDHLKVVDKLFARGAKINYVIEKGETPLMRIIGRISIKMLDHLIKHGADINAIDDQGNTLLHWAARYSGEKMFNYLLTLGMDKNLHVKNALGQSPFLIAAKYHNLDIMELLLSSDDKLDINQHDAQNNNAMTLALVDNKLTSRSSKIAGFLINNGFDLMMKQGEQPTGLALLVEKTPSTLSSLSGYLDQEMMVKHNPAAFGQIMNSGLAPETLKRFLNDAKREVVNQRNTPLLEALLAAGMDPNGFVFGDDQLLTKVIEKNYMDMAALLINAGADVNAVNGKYFPLRQAVFNDDAEAVTFLLDAGAKVELLFQNDLPLNDIQKYYPNAAEVIQANRTDRTLKYGALVLFALLVIFGVIWFIARRQKGVEQKK